MRFTAEQHAHDLQPAGDEERQAARDALAALSRPRLAGTEGAADVAAELRRRFQELGYEIRELPFRFSTLPGRFGVPIAGVLFLIGAATVLAGLLTGRTGLALVAVVATGALMGVLGAFARSAIQRLPWARIDSANWLIHRPGARPRYLLMAHRDSKSQPISLLLRASALAAAGIGWLILLVLTLLAFATGAVWGAAVVAAGALALVGGLGSLFCWAGNESPGALDNASGLAALLGVARLESDHDDVGFLITDGEELGLAGAWAVRRELPPVFGIINVDGLDDAGEFRIIERHGMPRRGLAPHLAAPMLYAAEALGLGATRDALPFGVLTDHVPLVDAGIPAVTLMRGGAGSLRRVHRPGDDAQRLQGDGVASGVALLRGALHLLRTAERPAPRPGLVPGR